MKRDSKRKRIEKLFSQLQNERHAFEARWEDIADYMAPSRPQWDNRGVATTGLTTDQDVGIQANKPPDYSNVIDSTATFSGRTLGAGMMSGLTSPARKWMEMAIDEVAEMLYPELADWLYLATNALLDIFGASNLYKVLPSTYEDMGFFGTSPMGIFEDFDTTVRFEHYPVGSYYIGLGRGGRVEVFARKFSMTVRQLVNDYAKNRFGEIDEDGLKKLSDMAQEAWRSGHTEQRVNVVQLVKENEDYDPRKLDAKYKRFMSVHYETNSDESKGFIRESGFDRFPILVGRWQVSGSDVYGTNCPGMVALGDVKQLQLGELRSLQAIEKKVHPAMVASLSMRNSNISTLPGDIIYEPDFNGRNGVRPAHTVDLSINEMEQKNAQVRERIKEAFFVNLFLMLASRAGDQPLTATEVNELREEKLFALGPVLQRVDEDLIDPLVEITLELAIKQGRIPPPPESAEGMDYKIEKKSVVAQAQSAFGLSKVERFVNFVNQTAPIDPTILDKVNMDAVVEDYHMGLSLPPKFMRPDEEVAQIRQQRAQQEAAAQGAQNIAQMAGAAKTASEAQTGEGNLLEALIRAEGGE